MVVIINDNNRFICLSTILYDMTLNLKLVRVGTEMRLYKCDNDTINYMVLSRYDMSRLTDLCIVFNLLPYNHKYNVEFCKQWFNYTI